MNKEILSEEQAISMIFLFMTGTSSIFVRGMEAKKDVWMAILLAIFAVLLITRIHVKILSIFPQKDWFDILEMSLGKFIGKMVCIFFIAYVLMTYAIVLRNIGEFINLTSLEGTPLMVPVIVISLACIWVVKEGMEVLGRWAKFFAVMIAPMIIITILLLTTEMEINNIRPVLNSEFKEIIQGAFSTFTFPFAEIIAFTMILSNYRTKKSYLKIYTIGLIGGGIFVLLTSTTNILVIGVKGVGEVYYPSYASVARLSIGGVIQRFEVISAFVFILGGYVKLSVYLCAACKGITKVFGFKDYRFLVTPVTLLIINASYFLFDSKMDFVKWNKNIWKYFSFPFQVIFPIIIFLIVMMKRRKEQDEDQGILKGD